MNVFELVMLIIFHPIDAFYYIKLRRDHINYISVLFMLLGIVAVKIISIFITHFPIASIQPKDASIWLEAGKILIPILTWVISSYAITSIKDGETLLGEILTVTAYVMLPYIIFTIPLALSTRLMGIEQLNLYGTLQTIIRIWILILLFLSVYVMNTYTISECIKVCILSVIVMFLIWGVLILIFALTSQLMHFTHDIFLEIKMLFLE